MSSLWYIYTYVYPMLLLSNQYVMFARMCDVLKKLKECNVLYISEINILLILNVQISSIVWEVKKKKERTLLWRHSWRAHAASAIESRYKFTY